MPSKRGSKAGNESQGRKVDLQLLATNVPGLDHTLGGGLPALSFNLIAGGPGTGKTTLAMQVLFANATAERPGLFFTLLGETSLKMLRYQQQLEFFDVDRALAVGGEAPNHCMQPTRAPSSCVLLRFDRRPRS